MPEPAEPDGDPIADTETDTEPEPASGTTTPAKGKGNLVTVLLAAATAVFVITSVVLLVLFAGAQSDHDAVKEQLTIRTTASRFAEAFVALDSSGPLPDQDAVVAELGTGPIVAQHTEAMGALRNAYKAFGAISARADVKGTYLSQIDDANHEATVLVNLTLNVAGQSQTVPNESYLEVHLVKVDGKWKVDGVTDIRGRLGAQTTPTSAPTATSAPATTAPATSSAPG